MLVLTRKIDEAIMIGDGVKVIIVDVRGDQVKIGVEAPRNVAIHRLEVYEDIQAENHKAALTQTIDVRTLSEMLADKSSRDTQPESESS